MSVNDFFSLGGALLAGGLIGVERSYHGHAAGMRTYALVCLGSALVIIAAGSADPNVTRVIQGIMTGIGFLGAGVIVNEGLSVRGLTSAASIWVTAGIGVLVGIKSYPAAAAATALTLGTLAVFRWIEDRLPARSYLHCSVRFQAGDRMDEDALREFLGGAGFRVAELSYRLHGDPKVFEYRLILWSRQAGAARALAQALTQRLSVAEFRISPSKD